MMEQNRTDREETQEQTQASQMSTADIASRSNKGNGDTNQPMPGAASRERAAGASRAAPLLSEREVQDLRARWTDIQAGFVDKPRESVEGADALVATVMQRLAETFANERASLEQQWGRGDDVSTEDLRLALQHYRSFFDRLLSL
jgi:hypothetical protein